MQRRAGVVDEARAVGRIIAPGLPRAAASFLARQRLAVASSLEANGRVWASLLTGPAGFLAPVDNQLLRIAAQPTAGDPLAGNLAARPELGLLAFDATRRQRMRFNGRGLQTPDGIFLMVEQAYGNCTKYIQLRRLDSGDEAAGGEEPRVETRLSSRQQAWIGSADTFFIASFHLQGGADASHRGGFPGFVRALGPRRVGFADYPGNAMFNTLGNLVAHPRAGLLFVDFTNGHVLQMTGEARVARDFSVEVQVEEVRETLRACPLRFALLEYSPVNPPVSRRAAAGISRKATHPTERRNLP